MTRLIREQALRTPKKRSGLYTFGPGEEMQHDTSPHRLRLGEKTLTAQCASLVLAYSRRLFIQYYPAFTRFEAKTFLTEAFRLHRGHLPALHHRQHLGDRRRWQRTRCPDRPRDGELWRVVRCSVYPS